MRRRSAFEIISDMLFAALSGVNKTSLINSCRMTHKMCEEYITILLKKGLLKKKDGRFYTTKRGTQFLGKYQELNRLLEKRAKIKIVYR
jgi:predicted transcriptional regulator